MADRLWSQSGPEGGSPVTQRGIENSYVAWFNTFQPVPRGREDAERNEPSPSATTCDFENAVRHGLRNNLALLRARFVASTGELDRQIAILRQERDRERAQVESRRQQNNRAPEWLLEPRLASWSVISVGIALWVLLVPILHTERSDVWLEVVLAMAATLILIAWSYFIGHRVRIARSGVVRGIWMGVGLAAVLAAIVSPVLSSDDPLVYWAGALVVSGFACIAGIAYLAHDSDPAFERSYRTLRRLERLLSDRSAQLSRIRSEAYALACRTPSYAREIVHVYRKANVRARNDGKVPAAFTSEPAFPDVSADDYGLGASQQA